LAAAEARFKATTPASNSVAARMVRAPARGGGGARGGARTARGAERAHMRDRGEKSGMGARQAHCPLPPYRLRPAHSAPAAAPAAATDAPTSPLPLRAAAPPSLPSRGHPRAAARSRPLVAAVRVRQRDRAAGDSGTDSLQTVAPPACRACSPTLARTVVVRTRCRQPRRGARRCPSAAAGRAAPPVRPAGAGRRAGSCQS